MTLVISKDTVQINQATINPDSLFDFTITLKGTESLESKQNSHHEGYDKIGKILAKI
jgi:hypothetical protein